METKRILFVDDDEMVALLAGMTLRRLGHSAACFGTAEAALAALRADPAAFDLLVTDLRLGTASGLDLATAARAVRQDLPVVLVSGTVERADDDRARALGLGGVLPKAEVMAGLAPLLQRLFG